MGGAVVGLPPFGGGLGIPAESQGGPLGLTSMSGPDGENG